MPGGTWQGHRISPRVYVNVKGKEAQMDFDLTDRQQHWQGRVREFVERKIRPAIPTYHEQDAAGDRWKVIQVVEDLKAEAKAAGIWTLFMPPRNAAHHQIDETIAFEGPGLTNLEYALCAVELGRMGAAGARRPSGGEGKR